MPQQPAALLPNTGVAASRGFTNATTAVSGESSTRSDAFTLALRESQSILNEPVTENDLAQLLLPESGNQLPLESTLSDSASGKLLDDLQIGEPVSPIPAQLAIQTPGIPGGASVAQQVDESVSNRLASQLQLRVENGQVTEGAGQGKVVDRLPDALIRNIPQAVKDSTENINREQIAFQRDLVDPMKSEFPLNDRPATKIALDAAKSFMNISGMAGAENASSISPLSSGQLLIQQSGDKVMTTLTMNTPLQSREWKEEVGDRVRWLISQKIQTAEIKINPPQLGSVEIRINVQNEQVSIQFNTANAMVKDTLEESLPRLREILNSSGLDLVDVDVSQHSDAEGKHAENDVEDADPEHMQDAQLSQHDENEMKIDTEAILVKGMVDMYA